MSRRILRTAASLTVGVALALSAVAGPAQAQGKVRKPVAPSVTITTAAAVALADYYYDEFAQQWVVFRPAYPLTTTVLCPKGAAGSLGVDPVNGNTVPGIDFTCTGAKQKVTFANTAAVTDKLGLSKQRPTATLYVNHTAVDTDTRTILVRTKAR